MATRSLKVEFAPTDAVDDVRTEAQVHDVSIDDAPDELGRLVTLLEDLSDR